MIEIKIVGYSLDAPFSEGKGYLLWEVIDQQGVKLMKTEMPFILNDGFRQAREYTKVRM